MAHGAVGSQTGMVPGLGRQERKPNSHMRDPPLSPLARRDAGGQDGEQLWPRRNRQVGQSSGPSGVAVRAGPDRRPRSPGGRRGRGGATAPRPGIRRRPGGLAGNVQMDDLCRRGRCLRALRARVALSAEKGHAGLHGQDASAIQEGLDHTVSRNTRLGVPDHERLW